MIWSVDIVIPGQRVRNIEMWKGMRNELQVCAVEQEGGVDLPAGNHRCGTIWCRRGGKIHLEEKKEAVGWDMGGNKVNLT